MTLRQTAAAPTARTHRGAPAVTPGTGRFAPTAHTHRKDRP